MWNVQVWKCGNEFEKCDDELYEPICIATMMLSLRRTLVRFNLYSTSIHHIET
jgi:hypothetical protein